MPLKQYGRVLSGSEEAIHEAFESLSGIPVDMEWPAEPGASDGYSAHCTTLGESAAISGPGTYFGKAERTLTFRPSQESGWWFERSDLPDSLPIRVSVRNVWTTVRNIVLLSGSPHNYMRMVEHIIALKVGMGLDNVVIAVESGDPPLFDRGSMDLVEAVERAGIVETGELATFLTVREPVSVGGANGSFLTFLPAENGSRDLHIDCTVDFRNAIGRQRTRFKVDNRSFRHGALARTNTDFWTMVYCRTIGKIFADVRNLGYTRDNILVAGRREYFNEAKLIHEGKSLEAVWHRAALDLLAAVALIDRGRLAGEIVSYKAGHALDVSMVASLYRHDLLEPVAQ